MTIWMSLIRISINTTINNYSSAGTTTPGKSKIILNISSRLPRSFSKIVLQIKLDIQAKWAAGDLLPLKQNESVWKNGLETMHPRIRALEESLERLGTSSTFIIIIILLRLDPSSRSTPIRLLIIGLRSELKPLKNL